MSTKFEINTIGIALAAYRPAQDVFFSQLKSIQDQTFRQWTCVITSDSSMIGFQEDPRFSGFFSDQRFVWIENSSQLGHKKNFNKAILEVQKRRVDAIACSDQDDLWYPQKLEVCREELQQSGRLSMVHSDMNLLKDTQIDSVSSVWKIERRGVDFALPRHLLVRNVVAGCSMLFDAELARRYPEIPKGAEFHDHWYALTASFFGGVKPIHQALFAYRQHSSNVVGVTPFHGIFYFPRNVGLKAIREKCYMGWLKSRDLAREIVGEGLQLSSQDHRTFLGADLGANLLRMAWEYRDKDPPLSRASLARGFGKLFSYLSPSG